MLDWRFYLTSPGRTILLFKKTAVKLLARVLKPNLSSLLRIWLGRRGVEFFESSEKRLLLLFKAFFFELSINGKRHDSTRCDSSQQAGRAC